MTDCIETNSPILSKAPTTGRTTVWMLVNRAVTVAMAWQRRKHERRHLAELDEYLLRDMGLSRADVTHETTKPFWKP
jgi:uncharacterized protein YjiS (DUF1127 family)